MPSAALQEAMPCPSVALSTFHRTMWRQIWMGNALLLASVPVIGVMVGIGSYGPRYRHHRFTRFVFVGSSTLFLPIVSYVVSTLSDSSNDYVNKLEDGTTLVALCRSSLHPCMVIAWAFLVQMAALSTASVVAIGTTEGRKEGPPWELLVQGIWTFYLGASITNSHFFHGFFRISPRENNKHQLAILIDLSGMCSKIMFAPFVLLSAKIWFKWYSFQKAQKSFALGRNPGLVFGYMQQLQEEEEEARQRHGGPTVGDQDALCPPLLVMGEDTRLVERQPWGYVFTDIPAMAADNGLVTLDRIWKLDSMLPTSTPRLKDLCLSFTLFKLLRSRLASYDLSNNNVSLKFFWSQLMNDGEHDRVFRVIADEVSFVHDYYYYSSFPISYAKCWLPLLSIFISLFSICYCIAAAYFFTVVLAAYQVYNKKNHSQIHCDYWCSKPMAVILSKSLKEEFGYLYYDLLPALVLLLLVLVAEVRDISSYICSNWTKVALISHCASCSASLQHPHRVHKLFGILLQWKCRIINHWDGNIGQCSVLVLHPTARTTLTSFLSRLFHSHLPDVKRKVKVPAAVKVSILEALRSTDSSSSSSSSGCQLGNGRTSLQRSQVGENFLWACNGRSTSEIILTWHIATCVLEIRHPDDQAASLPTPSPNQHKVAATHLSRYCAYLMTWSPELLPDEDAWNRSQYEAVKKNAERVLAGRVMAAGPPETEYQDLVRLLSEGSNHLVLKNGVRLGKQLVELDEGEETAWSILAGFWAEMILYVAPSTNLKAHKRAIARGGELITLLWALLFHAGIISRHSEASGAATVGDSV